ncbi:SCO family protein [Anaerobacillus sp. MEB173]|uniref:SCO family protein n=1 Tax=Anaerobacillus sp. MEB173 TaxID=3383345 RepID=UPI003F922BB6
MNKYFLKKNFIMCIILIGLLVIAGCSSEAEQEPDPNDISQLGKYVPEFSYTNQHGEPFGSEDLAGQYWIANMIFTNCNTVCPPMTINMARLQEMLRDSGLSEVQLVSFSVDPANDTPASLKEFGEKLNADFSNWNFLTGYEQEEFADMAYETFMTIVENEPDSDQVQHGTSFYLIDPTGLVVRLIGGLDQPDEELINTIAKIVK